MAELHGYLNLVAGKSSKYSTTHTLKATWSTSKSNAAGVLAHVKVDIIVPETAFKTPEVVVNFELPASAVLTPPQVHVTIPDAGGELVP